MQCKVAIPSGVYIILRAIPPSEECAGNISYLFLQHCLLRGKKQQGGCVYCFQRGNAKIWRCEIYGKYPDEWTGRCIWHGFADSRWLCSRLLRPYSPTNITFQAELLHIRIFAFLSFHFLVIAPMVCYTSCKAHIAYGFGSVYALVFLDISENLYFHEKKILGRIGRLICAKDWRDG